MNPTLPDQHAARHASVADFTRVRGAAGFHRVGRDPRGRWWLIAPDDRPWFHRGVTSVHVRPPDAEPPPEAQRAAGPALPLDTPDRVIAWLRGLGFNALGAWTNEALFDRGMPYAVLIHTRRICPEATILDRGVKMIDVFDPRFHAAYETACRERAGALAGSRDLIGYFTDNEPGWGQAHREHVWGGNANVAPNEPTPLLLQACLALPPERPAHAAAWRFVLDRHGGSVGALAAAWGETFADPAEFGCRHAAGLVLDTPAYHADHEAFSAHFARAYFRFTADCLRRHDPNHLILGCRYGGNPGPVILAAQREAFASGWCDILSMNSYRADLARRVGAYADATGMPVLNGEFAWASDYFKWPRADGSDAGLALVEWVTRRGVAALEGGIAHPALVGYSWFKCRHNFIDADRPHYGLVNQAGVANRFNTARLAAINARAERLARGETAPAAVELGPIRAPETVGI